MAQRIIRNDFVAGEISPELWGRHDVDCYCHGAAKIENFVPRWTGGVRKRAGTEYLNSFSRTNSTTGAEIATEFRAIPYKYNKDCYGILVLARHEGETALRANMYSSLTGTRMGWQTIGLGTVALPTGASLADVRYTQIGDTIFFTHPGATAWKAVVTFPEDGTTAPSIVWESLSTDIPVATPVPLEKTDYNDDGHSGFGEIDDEKYFAGSRKYCLWGVKNGVRSAPRYRTAKISLPWKSGAVVTIKFAPDWAAHDYYILGKLQGAQYGEVARFYISSAGETDKAVASFSDNSSSCRDSGGTDGTASGPYQAAASDSTGWSKLTPNEKTSDGRHRYGTFCHYVRANIDKDYQTNYITGLKIWFGAKMAQGGAIYNVGCSEPTTAVVWVRGEDDAGGQETWTRQLVYRFTPGYNAGATIIPLDTPVAAKGVRIYFYSEGYVPETNNGTAFYIPVRGMRVVCTGSDTCTFKDDNISPGTIVGEQTAIRVGDSDMAVNLVSAWQQRFIAAGSATMPFTLWFSAIGDLYNFYQDTPQTSDNAFEATIASTEANRINHIVAQKWLLVFTESGEYIIDSTGGALAFNTADIKKLSSVVAHSAIPPVCTESEVLFVSHDARTVYKMDYTLERDSVVPTNLSIRAEHVAAGSPIVAIAYQRFPDSVLWCLLADGTLASLTFCPEENVCAWAHHTLAGGAGLKAVDIFSTGSVSSSEGTATTSDIVLVLTHADHPGKIWLERLRPNVVADSLPISQAQCRDHMGYPGSAIDGVDPMSDVQASFETIRLEPQQIDTIGKSAAQFEATLRVLRSGKLAVAPVTDGGTGEWRYNATQQQKLPVATDESVSLARGDVRISPQVLYNREARFAVKSADGYPCDILALCVAGNFGTMKEGV